MASLYRKSRRTLETDNRNVTVTAFIVHGWRYFRRRGLKATVRTMIHRFIYGFHKFVVYRTCLAGPPAADHVRDIMFRLATPADLDHLAEFFTVVASSSTSSRTLDFCSTNACACRRRFRRS